MDRFIIQHNRPIQYSTFRQLALINQQLRDAAGNQRNNDFFDEDMNGAELEQGGQLDLSFEEDDNVNDNITNNTNSTSNENQEAEDMVMIDTEIQEENSSIYGSLQRRSPLIKPDKKKFDFDSAEYFRESYLRLSSSNNLLISKDHFKKE
ncbi:UNKNOWN [Stylonychia lemnae]|uniref:Uncharacterized protein n=1 Tax=Stylonychia lemnae TaxID=5949 RepID=A0A077ZSR0_STYLE|nr:UNKNOWN [Stylonychia lemnae]|eukprot:CDW71511.1 UNKNOWN [Stylonychia lemnae]